MRRVVVTGLGLVTPLASGLEKSWKRLIAGQSGAGSITRFNPVGLSAQVACEVPLGDGTNGTFNADDWMEPKNRKRVDDFILYGDYKAQVMQIGNAVASRFAYHIGKYIINILH